MTKYLNKSFNSPANSTKYVDNYEKVFGEESKDEEVVDKFISKRRKSADFIAGGLAEREAIVAWLRGGNLRSDELRHGRLDAPSLADAIEEKEHLDLAKKRRK